MDSKQQYPMESIYPPFLEKNCKQVLRRDQQQMHLQENPGCKTIKHNTRKTYLTFNKTRSRSDVR